MPMECVWVEDGDHQFESGCGRAYWFEDGGPIDHGYNYCPFCGNMLNEILEDDNENTDK